MRKVYVRLAPNEVAALVQMAQTERRHPSDQAGLLISKALEQASTPPSPSAGG